MRRRLRELTDRSLALGSVHSRFVPDAPLDLSETHEPASIEGTTPSVPSPAPAPEPRQAPLLPIVVRPDEEVHAKLLTALRERHGDGFTVGQMRDLLDELESPRAHSYDAAWALANNLVKSRTLEVAGFRTGEKGPIRILRVAGRGASPAGAS